VKGRPVLACTYLAEEHGPLTVTFDDQCQNQEEGRQNQQGRGSCGDVHDTFQDVLSPGVLRKLNVHERQPIDRLPFEFSPVRDNSLYVRTHEIEAVLDAMFRVWVTEVRPRILNQQTGPNATPADQSVLLARLTVTVSEGWQTNTVTVHEEERPYLLHTRLIQEYLLNREQSRDHDQLLGLDLDDHKQYLLVNPEDRSLIADLNADGHKVVNLRAAEYDGEAVPFEQAVKVDDAAGGDVGGTFRNQLKVKGIMGRTILDTAPQPGAYLVFNGDAWEPKAAPPGVTEHAKLKGLDQDDHKQYLLANGGRALGGNLDANQKRIINLSQSVPTATRSCAAKPLRAT
jgi:hypothetical protein